MAPIIAETPQANLDFQNLIDFGSLVVDEMRIVHDHESKYYPIN